MPTLQAIAALTKLTLNQIKAAAAKRIQLGKLTTTIIRSKFTQIKYMFNQKISLT